MSKLLATTIILLVLPNATGCAAIIAADAIGRHDDRRRQEINYRHQERMKELELQEKLMNKQYPQQPTSNGDAGIVRDNPF